MNQEQNVPEVQPSAFSSEEGAHYEGRDLEAMSFAKNYYAWIERIFGPYLKGVGMEVGAGSGNFTEILRSHPFTSLVALEPSFDMHKLLQERFSADALVTTHNKTLSEVHLEYPATFDAVVYINVLEHVEDDAREMEYAHSVLKKGGAVCIFVPALQWLYSPFDASVGHYRRYYKKDLEKLLESKGFEVIRSSYFDFVGIWPWLIFFKFLKLTLSGGKTKAYDEYVVPVMSRIESVIPVPLGKNVIIVARKK